MPISVVCQKCAATINVPDNAVGKSAPCPRCKKAVKLIARPRSAETPDEADDFTAISNSPRPRKSTQQKRGSWTIPVVVVGVVVALLAVGVGIFFATQNRNQPGGGSVSGGGGGGKPNPGGANPPAIQNPFGREQDEMLQDQTAFLLSLLDYSLNLEQLKVWRQSDVKSDAFANLSEQSKQAKKSMDDLQAKLNRKWGSRLKSLQQLSEDRAERFTKLEDGATKIVRLICQKHELEAAAELEKRKAKFVVENPLRLDTDVPEFGITPDQQRRRDEFIILMNAKNKVLKADHNVKVARFEVQAVSEILPDRIERSRRECDVEVKKLKDAFLK